MLLIKPRSIASFFLISLLIFLFNGIPSKAASVLAAWLITSDGVLKLRTSSGADLKAYYQSGYESIGDRLWIDFPGELSKPRTLRGNGPIKEIRLGKPFQGNTRLVVEFDKGVSLEPSKLKLLGKSPTLWELKFFGLSSIDLKSIGEGDVINASPYSHLANSRNGFLSTNINVNSLPNVEIGRFKVIIDPGHGGPDIGAMGIKGLKETDIVLNIAKHVSRYLSAKGVDVQLTRYKEIDLDLPERVLIANRSNANAFVSIHANATRGYRRDVSGIETYFYSGFNGENLASKIQKELVAVPGGSPDRGVRKSRFFVIRHTHMPAALVEVGFITGRLDARLLSQDSYRKEIAFAISKGILKYLKETY